MMIVIQAQRSQAFWGIPGCILSDKSQISWSRCVTHQLCDLPLACKHDFFLFFLLSLLFFWLWTDLSVILFQMHFYFPLIVLTFSYRNSSISRFSGSEAGYYKSDSQLDVLDELDRDNSSLEVSSGVGFSFWWAIKFGLRSLWIKI